MNIVTEKVLEKLKQPTFTHHDIKALFPGNDGSRYALMNRALKSGEVIRLRRGFYCLARKFQNQPLNLFSVAHQCYGPSYISLESALSFHGLIPEGVFDITSISFNKSLSFSTPLGRFVYKHIPLKDFFQGVERKVEDGHVFYMAAPWKALCDYVYVYKMKWKSIDPLVKSLRVEQSDLQTVHQEDLLRLRNNVTNRAVHQFIDGVMKELR